MALIILCRIIKLHPVVERPQNLRLTEPETTKISSTSPTIQGKVGDLIIFETHEHYDGGIISIDVGEWVSRHGDFVTVVRYWYNHENQWIKWDNQNHDLYIQDIKIVGFKLTAQKHTSLYFLDGIYKKNKKKQFLGYREYRWRRCPQGIFPW